MQTISTQYEPSTLSISISDADRDLIKAHTGVPFVTAEVKVLWIPAESDYGPYVAVEHMEGLCDADIRWLLTEIANRNDGHSSTEAAKMICEIADGFCSFNTDDNPRIPSHMRIYRD